MEEGMDGWKKGWIDEIRDRWMKEGMNDLPKLASRWTVVRTREEHALAF